MTQTGIASATALLNEARRHDDDGDGALAPRELARAASVLENVVDAHDVRGIVDRTAALAQRPGVSLETLGHIGETPIQALKLPSVGPTRRRVLITAGVHGDEPCGPGAALLTAEQLLADPTLRTGLEVTVVPMVNPRGSMHAMRRSPEGVDINRHCDTEPGGPPEVQILEAFMQNNDYDMALDLHSGGKDRNGFWLLHIDADDLMGPAMARLGSRWPLLHGDTRPYDLSAAGVGTGSSTTTVKNLAHNTGVRWVATLEAPGSVSYLDQVLGQNDMVHELLGELRSRDVAGADPMA